MLRIKNIVIGQHDKTILFEKISKNHTEHCRYLSFFEN